MRMMGRLFSIQLSSIYQQKKFNPGQCRRAQSEVISPARSCAPPPPSMPPVPTLTNCSKKSVGPLPTSHIHALTCSIMRSTSSLRASIFVEDWKEGSWMRDRMECFLGALPPAALLPPGPPAPAATPAGAGAAPERLSVRGTEQVGHLACRGRGGR